MISSVLFIVSIDLNENGKFVGTKGIFRISANLPAAGPVIIIASIMDGLKGLIYTLLLLQRVVI